MREISHVGVKGMHWGVRKAKPVAPLNPNYTQKQQKVDRLVFGNKNVARISKKMDAGRTHGSAVRRMVGGQVAVSAGITAASIILPVVGGVAMSSLRTAAATRMAGRAAASTVGLGASTMIKTGLKRGAYKITTMR